MKSRYLKLIPGMKKSRTAECQGQGSLRKLHYPHARFSRREVLGSLALLPFAGKLMPSVLKPKRWISYEEENLLERLHRPRLYGKESLNPGDIQIPKAKIAGESFSRLILGGNLIGGWAHARDLVYVSDLVKKYFTDEKVFETFTIAESFGINAFLTNPLLIPVINAYWNKGLGKIKFISDCGGKTLEEGIRVSIDHGASACYVHGQMADDFVAAGKVEEIGKGLEMIRKNKLPAGIGGHKLETIKACVEAGITPDFWMKTIHRTDYWSANKISQNDNIWCTDPDEVRDFMKNLRQPWIGYKIMAAGAIEPRVGIKYAFESGADFLCMGMFDFQIADDIKTFVDVFNSDLKRERPWMA